MKKRIPKAKCGEGKLVVFTLGHSTRSPEAFLTILSTHGIMLLADIRSFPSSKRFPHLNQEPLAHALAQQGIQYLHLKSLGGFRRPKKNSPNTAIKSPGFRGYADHMQTEEFRRALKRLREAATQERTAVMCAEALPWRCHRFFLSDALTAKGIRVLHILDEKHVQEHKLSKEAKVVNGEVIYPADEKLSEPYGNR